MMRSIGSSAPLVANLLGKSLLLICFLSPLFFTSCYRAQREISPKINYTIQDRYLKNLPSPFPPLTPEERDTPWGIEYTIGLHFARQLDFYRAITAFQRAEILAPPNLERRREIEYEILLCYYLGKKYQEVDITFGKSHLADAPAQFPPFHDLLLILYDTYQQLGMCDKVAHLLGLIKKESASDYSTLLLSSALLSADMGTLREIASQPPPRPYLNQLLNNYEFDKKSPSKAAFLNALLPGSGYLYLGQRQTAITAFLVNGLFIASALHFFIHGPIAAGIIMTSLESGWYFGGIYGAAREAKFYNERLYETMATPMMNQHRLFPVFRLTYAF